MRYKFVIVGAGNTAHLFAAALTEAGHHLTQIISRNPETGAHFADVYSCEFNTEIKQINKSADVCILATSDDSLSELAPKIREYFSGILIHCSGSCPLSVLDSGSLLPHGVLYPLQSISSKNLPDKKNIPLLVEASDEQTLKTIEEIATELCGELRIINSEQRLKLHLAAVLVSNFCNHLYSKAEEVAVSSGLEFSLLHPLMVETLRKAMQDGPYNSQTGPARRKDVHTMQQHLELLKNDEDLAILYKLISDSIGKTYS